MRILFICSNLTQPSKIVHAFGASYVLQVKKKSEVDPMSLGDILASSTFVGGILGSKLGHT